MSALDRVITCCPQCAGKNTHILVVTDMPKRMKKYHMECVVCGYCAPQAFTWRGAIKKWSREWQRRFLK